MNEICQNPFRQRKCKNTDIALYIRYEGDKRPICTSCWKKLSKSKHEWGEDNKNEKM